MPLMVVHVDEVESFHWRLYVTAPVTAVQLAVALVLVMLEELKLVGTPQLAAVVNDAAVLYELDPDEQTVCTWNWYAVPAVSPVKLREVVVMPLTVVHVDEEEALHLRL